MDLALGPQDQAFRDEVRRFLDDNLSDDLREAGRKTGGVFAEFSAGLRWHKILARRGWSAPTWPNEYGGTGWDATERYIFARECAAVDAPRIFSMGLRMVSARATQSRARVPISPASRRGRCATATTT
jgi:alkylation response protein AidB-like acyl-CoA dehydrogenase